MIKKKKIILTIIDSFHPKALANCFRENSVPALAFLKEKGFHRDDCISVFPTMTPVAASSIVTGRFPDFHQVPGFIWFDRIEKRFINYGATLSAVLKMGVYQVIQDLIFNLNNKQLNKKAKTIFEILEEAGFSTAAINFFIYRGKNLFSVNVPWLVKLFTRFKFLESLFGPKILFFGEICKPAKLFRQKNLQLPVGPFNKFGVNDDFSGIVSSQVIKEGLQPDFMLVYLPDTDHFAHRNDPCHSEESLVKADYQLQRILNSFKSWEEAIEKNIFIIVGDHAQSIVRNDSDFAIDIPGMLNNFKQVALGKRMFLKKELAVCPNERMAHIYIFKKKLKIIQKITKLLRRDPRIDQIAWKERKGGRHLYHVICGKDNLSFWRNGKYIDEFQQGWGFEGNLKVVEGVALGNQLTFNEFPDAFNRIATILDCQQSGEVVVTAKLGYEISGEAAALHPGCGSHGSLHREDSLVPLVVAGSDKFNHVRRITDLYGAILNHFGLH